MARALALDLDGTLISCAPRHCALMAQVCRGDALPKGFFARFWADKREGGSNLSSLKAQGHPAASARAQAWLREIEHWPWLGFDRLLPGVASALSARLFPILVLTARREPFFVRQQLDRLGLTGLIDDLIVVHPGNAAEAKADQLARIRPLAFIGDTESDADAAYAVGAPFIALNCGMRSSGFWQRRGQLSYPDIHAAFAALPV